MLPLFARVRPWLDFLARMCWVSCSSRLSWCLNVLMSWCAAVALVRNSKLMPTCAAICSTPTPVIQISLFPILLASFRITHFSTSETFASDSLQFFGVWRRISNEFHSRKGQISKVFFCFMILKIFDTEFLLFIPSNCFKKYYSNLSFFL